MRLTGSASVKRRGFGMLAAPVCAAVLAALAGCGYQSGSPAAHGVRTVRLAMFDNASFHRGLEVDLTDALRRELARRTRLRLVDREEAASTLTGRISAAPERVLTHDAANRALTKEINVIVSFEWRDSATGQLLAREENLSRPAQVSVATDDTLGSAAAETLRQLAQAIVDRMEGSW